VEYFKIHFLLIFERSISCHATCEIVYDILQFSVQVLSYQLWYFWGFDRVDGKFCQSPSKVLINLSVRNVTEGLQWGCSLALSWGLLRRYAVIGRNFLKFLGVCITVMNSRYLSYTIQIFVFWNVSAIFLSSCFKILKFNLFFSKLHGIIPRFYINIYVILRHINNIHIFYCSVYWVTGRTFEHIFPCLKARSNPTQGNTWTSTLQYFTSIKSSYSPFLKIHPYWLYDEIENIWWDWN